MNQNATFADLIDFVDSEQTLADIDFDDPSGNLTVFKKARGVYINLLKGIKFAKHQCKHGLAHSDDPTQWDHGEYSKTELATLEGLPLK